MFRTGNSGWLAIAAIVATCLLITSVGWAQAQPQAQPYDTFQVNYFSNANNSSADEWVRIINTGADAPTYPPSNLCAMIYVFDSKQELKECCGCLISTDGLAELSLDKNLVSNPFDGRSPRDGDIKIVSAAPNDVFGGVPCDPTGGGIGSNGKYVLNIVPTVDLRSWGTHVQNSGNLTEDEFQTATLATAELDSLQEECYGIVTVGSGAGICGEGVGNSSTVCN
jgi:hypothetical protein